MLFVVLGEVDDTARFFERFFPGANAICDPEQLLYAAFGLGHGSLSAFLAPSVFASALRALAQGHGIGMPSGDVLTLSGSFLLRDGRVLWSHYAATAADHPDWNTIPAQLAR